MLEYIIPFVRVDMGTMKSDLSFVCNYAEIVDLAYFEQKKSANYIM